MPMSARVRDSSAIYAMRVGLKGGEEKNLGKNRKGYINSYARRYIEQESKVQRRNRSRIHSDFKVVRYFRQTFVTAAIKMNVY